MTTHNTALDVLVVDDEDDIAKLLAEILIEEGFSPRIAHNSDEAFAKIEQKVPAAIILDIWLQGSEIDGLGILEIVKKRYPLMPIIVISGHGTIQTAVTAIKLGAYNYIEKPFTHDKLMIMLKRACESSRLKRENLDLKAKVIDKTEIIGTSSCVNKLKSQVEKIAPTSGRVLMTGNAGVGKELFARILHKKSKNANGPFIRFSPTGMSVEKIQQDLFGDPEKNDVTGVYTYRTSLFEAAHNGTLYIDEVADIPLQVQIRLLQTIQSQNIEKNGRTIKIETRIIAATTRNLEQEINNGKFNKDLYYRLNVIPLHIPDLAERKDDIPILVDYFVHQLVKSSGLKPRIFAPDSIAALQAYNWPGNIRELRNVVEWSMIMNPVNNDEDKMIRFDMLPPCVLSDSANLVATNSEHLVDVMSLPLREAREIFEKQYLSAQMSRFNNNISKTSAFIGMERSALHRKLKLLNIYSNKFKLDQEMGNELAN
ncbi:ATPase AAA [Candidatus Phycorickettsia trachydisci]|uniref:Putative response regulator NtrX-like n=1 Tax=Candidatus Phycorickettsia trachydisci TaxID=2115978 RepID=A0A2P1P8K1_9RICK|nr:sigma-54 dependent transcriptional regulator [Candidatus Phycorickettsia trachydisci]AVP87586.1 ATPase AAA [Candidatus Phycorickettsia trachydisci]